MIGSLFLSPRSTQDNAPLDVLQGVLEQLNIVAAPMQTSDRYRTLQAGSEFARHVVFAGCSPHLRFEARDPSDQHYCHVALHGPFEQAMVLTGQNTVKPRCPHCRVRIHDWQNRLDQLEWSCEGCSETLRSENLDWRQHAAVGRCFVELRNVFPGEASPSDQLLTQLVEMTGFTWRYAWAGLYTPADIQPSGGD